MSLAHTSFSIVLGTLVLGALCGASAQPRDDSEHGMLELQTQIEKVELVERDGETRAELVPAATTSPGDELVYTVVFTNLRAEPVDGVRITNPIPSGMRYVAGTAFGPGSDVLYSVDGGRTFGAPVELSVTADDGARRAAQAADYTHIRWILRAPLASGARGFARFRAVVK